MTIVDVLGRGAAQHAARTAFTFLPDGEDEALAITYGELETRARAVAAALQDRTAAGDRVLILCPPGLEYIAAFLGCQYAGAIAVPAYPPSAKRRRPGDQRLQTMAADAQIAAILTTSAYEGEVATTFEDAGQTAVPCLAVEAIPSSMASAWRHVRAEGRAIAFLQYTSGSTSRPKGVMVSHDNLLHNQRLIQEACDHTDASTFVSWLPLYHDMGLVGTIVQPLYIGASAVFMPPAAFLHNPLRWLRAIARFKGHTSGGPNFAYELCVRRIGDEQRAELDLRSWTVAFNGAEPVRADTLDRFAAAFAPSGFRREALFPCYGLAEATLIVSGRRRHPTPRIRAHATRPLDAGVPGDDGRGAAARRIVGCGAAVAETTIAIVDPETRALCPPNEPGEIWVSSPSVACGYWNQPEASDEIFRARPIGGDGTTFLRTGDLGLVSDDHLFVTGRLHDLIIVRGQNHHPEDIEWTVQQALPAVQPNAVAAFSVDVSGDERLVVIVEQSSNAALDGETLARTVRQAVTEAHALQVYAVLGVKLGVVPKTSSGKIQRHVCRREFAAGRIDTLTSSLLDTPPPQADARLDADVLDLMTVDRRRAKLEAYLAAYVGRIVGSGAAPIDRPLPALGIDSMTALELKHQLEADFGAAVALSDLLGDATVAALADRILERGSRAAMTSAVAPRDRGDEPAHPLSCGQQSLRFLHERAPRNGAYNIAQPVWVRGSLDVDALGRAFARVIGRHAALRSTFAVSGGITMQRPAAADPHVLVQRDASGWTERELDDRLVEEANAPFDLERGPVIRVRVFTVAPDRHALLVVVHHLVADLWSFGVILHDLGAAYQIECTGGAGALPEPSATYADYVRWQGELLSSDRGSELARFWRDQLAGDMPIADLPADAVRSETPTSAGARARFHLGPALAARVRELARERNVTPFVVLLAAFDALLHRSCGQREIVLGTLASGRTRPEFADLVGYFTNPIVLRSSLPAGSSFVELLDRTERTVRAAFDHQDYPFPLLVQHRQPERDDRRSPLFHVLFAMQKAPARYHEMLSAFAVGAGGATARLGGLDLEAMPFDAGNAQFDIGVFVAEHGDALEGVIEYSTPLFSAERMRRFAGHYLRLLEALVTHPAARVDDAPLVSREELRRLDAWNATDAALPNACVHHLFETQARRTPDAVAVVFGGQHVTYTELNRAANRLARHLLRYGVKPETPVGICLERRVNLVAAIWAVLKAGGAYVPLDPHDPADRLVRLLHDAGAPLVIADDRTAARVEGWPGRTVSLDAAAAAIASQADDDLTTPVDPLNLAYIIHTSGSTGRPKGAMNTHRSLLNRIEWMQQAYGLGAADRVLQKTPATFDVSVWEFTWPLMNGACLVVAAPGGHRDATYLARTIAEERITTVHFVPSMLELFLADRGAGASGSLRRVICSGEALTTSLASHGASRLDAGLHNLYGPTECAIDVSSWTYQPGDQGATVPIGGPIANVKLYVLTASLQLVPQGSAGELYIGGMAVGRGYLRQPALTAARFLPDPVGHATGARMYRTGDLVRARADGSLEFLGRLDRQVKIRGHRIELGEIESALLDEEQVRQAAVVVREDQPGDKRLVGYVVFDAPDGANLGQLWTSLAKRLPPAAMPAALVSLEALPLTAHGKLDVAALPAVDGARPERAGVFIAPRTPLERVIAEHWTKALGLDQVGIHDNFFEVGGHSLLATQLCWQLQELFHTEAPLLNLFFQSPTIAGLAEAIVREALPGVDPQRIAENVHFVQNLTDREAEQLLATVTP